MSQLACYEKVWLRKRFILSKYELLTPNIDKVTGVWILEGGLKIQKWIKIGRLNSGFDCFLHPEKKESRSRKIYLGFRKRALILK